MLKALAPGLKITAFNLRARREGDGGLIGSSECRCIRRTIRHGIGRPVACRIPIAGRRVEIPRRAASVGGLKAEED